MSSLRGDRHVFPSGPDDPDRMNADVVFETAFNAVQQTQIPLQEIAMVGGEQSDVYGRRVGLPHCPPGDPGDLG
jgi:hypothetical protein